MRILVAAGAATAVWCFARLRAQRRKVSDFATMLAGFTESISEHDADGDGELTPLEFERFVCESFGLAAVGGSGADFAAVLRQAIHVRRSRAGDPHCSAGVRCAEVARAFSAMSSGRKERLEFAFCIYDSDGDGVICVSDVCRVANVLVRVLSDLGIDPPQADSLEAAAADLFSRMDPDESGKVTFARFASLLHREPERFSLFGFNAISSRQNQNVFGKRLLFGDPLRRGLNLMLAIHSVIRLEPDVSPGLVTDQHFAEVRNVVVGGRTVRCYAPNVFRTARLRDGISNKKLVASLGVCGMLVNMLVGNLATLSAAGGAGSRSGAEFFQSYDGLFILKRVSSGTLSHLLDVLQRTEEYLGSNPRSLLVRTYGAFSVAEEGGWRHVLVMSNVLPTWCEIHQTFDLKGSTFRRTALPPGADPYTHRGLQKDVDVRSSGRTFRVGVDRDAVVRQIRRDAAHLASMDRYDYSLLVGLHVPSLVRGNLPRSRSAVSAAAASSPMDFMTRRQTWCTSLDPASAGQCGELGLGDSAAPQPSEGHSTRRLGSNVLPSGERVYFGVIDYLTPWSWRRVVERFLKRLWSRDREEVSVCPPQMYAERFVRMISCVLES